MAMGQHPRNRLRKLGSGPPGPENTALYHPAGPETSGSGCLRTPTTRDQPLLGGFGKYRCDPVSLPLAQARPFWEILTNIPVLTARLGRLGSCTSPHPWARGSSAAQGPSSGGRSGGNGVATTHDPSGLGRTVPRGSGAGSRAAGMGHGTGRRDDDLPRRPARRPASRPTRNVSRACPQPAWLDRRAGATRGRFGIRRSALGRRRRLPPTRLVRLRG